MLTIGLDLRHEISRVAVMEIQADQVAVDKVASIKDPLTQYVRDENVQALADFFESLKSEVGQAYKKAKDIKLFIAYPSNFGHIDWFKEKIASEQDVPTALPGWLYTHLQVEKKEDYFVDAPIVLSRGNEINITAMYIHKKYVHTMVTAARLAGFRACEGEPVVLAAVRLTDFQKASHFVEIGPESSTITSFDPGKGMFSLPLPTFGWEKILADGISELIARLAVADISIQNTFGVNEEDARIYLLTERDQEIQAMMMETNLSERLQVFEMPQSIQSRLNPIELLKYTGPMGLGLKSWAERMNVTNETNTGGKCISGDYRPERAVSGKAGHRVTVLNRIANLLAMRNQH